jgi:tellurite methyltransferase
MDSKTKWDSKYKERLKEFIEPVPSPRLQCQSAYLNGGTAIDLACGLGGNSLFLARLDYQVEAIDISDVAINYIEAQAQKHNLKIQPRVGDLTDIDNHNWPSDSFDIVVLTYYLDRTLFPIVKKIIKEGGYLFMETFYLSPQSKNQGVSNQYKLEPKELLAEFGDWNVLSFEENEQEGRQTIFCQKRQRGS